MLTKKEEIIKNQLCAIDSGFYQMHDFIGEDKAPCINMLVDGGFVTYKINGCDDEIYIEYKITSEGVILLNKLQSKNFGFLNVG